MGNFLYQAPECYDPTEPIAGKVYLDEYQKLGVEMKIEPSSRKVTNEHIFLIEIE